MRYKVRCEVLADWLRVIGGSWHISGAEWGIDPRFELAVPADELAAFFDCADEWLIIPERIGDPATRTSIVRSDELLSHLAVSTAKGKILPLRWDWENNLWLLAQTGALLAIAEKTDD